MEKVRIRWFHRAGMILLTAICMCWVMGGRSDAAEGAPSGTKTGKVQGTEKAAEMEEPMIVGQQASIYMDSMDEISIVGQNIQSVVYSSTDRRVAEVDEQGVVSGEKEGTAVIWAKVVYGDKENPKIKELSYKVRVLDNFTNYFAIKNGKIYGITDKGKMLKEMYIPDYCDFIRVKEAEWDKVIGGNQVVERLYLSDYMEEYSSYFKGSDIPVQLREIHLGRRMKRVYMYNRFPALETFVLHPQNKAFEVRDKVLFSDKELIYYPSRKTETVYKVPEDIQYIDSYAFCGVRNLTQVILPDKLENIRKCAFKNTYLTEVSIPFGAWLEEDVFADCTRLEKVVLPGKYYFSQMCIFRNCPVLKTAVVPNKAAGVCAGIFENCPAMQEFQITAGVSDYQVQNGVLFQKSRRALLAYPMGKRESSYKVPSGIKYIEAKAFHGAIHLTAVKLCETLLQIQQDAFRDCRSLKKIHIPSRVEYICFHEWGTGERGMFRGCKSLSEITVDSLNKHYSSQKGVLYSKTKDRLFCYPQNKKGKEFTVPGTVTVISSGAFAETIYLQKIAFGKKLKNIHPQVFKDSVALKSVKLPENVRSIGFHAFAGCKKLTKLVIPDRVAMINNGLLKDCTSLKEVVVGKSVKLISDYSFYRCNNLEKLTFRGKKWFEKYSKTKFPIEEEAPFYQAGSKRYSRLKVYVPKCTKSQKSKAKTALFNKGLHKKAKIVFATK